MATEHEIIKTPKALLAWVYLLSENQVYHVYDHWHLSLEITMGLKGSYRYRINNRLFTVKPGDILLINSGNVHACETSEPQRSDALSIIFPHEFLKKACENIDFLTFSLDRGTKETYRELKEAMDEMYAIFVRREEIPNYQLMLNSIVYRIIFLLINYFSDSSYPHCNVLSQRNLQQCERIIRFIDKQYQEPITLELLAQHMGISREHLSRIFKSNMGTTFKHYLTSIRMYYAYIELITTDMPIIDIALEQGFPDARAFIKSFKELYGITPLQYRKNHEHVSNLDHKKFVIGLY